MLKEALAAVAQCKEHQTKSRSDDWGRAFESKL